MAEVLLDRNGKGSRTRVAFERFEVPREGVDVTLTKPGGGVIKMPGPLRVGRLVSQDAYITGDGTTIFLNGYVDVYGDGQTGEGPVG